MKNKIALLILVLSFTCVVYGDSSEEGCSSTSYNELSDSCSGCAGVYDAYGYVSVGVGPIIFIPNVGMGYRERYAHYGWDGALNFATIGYAHQLSAHFVGHYYFSPLRKDSVYLGLGVMGSGIFTNHGEGGGTLSPDFVFGKRLRCSYDSRHFLEMHVAMPSLWIESGETTPLYFPLVYIKYGIAF